MREYLAAVWTTAVDKGALFSELLADRGIAHDWRDYAAVPITAMWAEVEPARRYEASDSIVWTYPGGRDEYTDLWLTVLRDPRADWDWTVSVDDEASARDLVLESGTSASLESAKDECERAASDLIARRERESAGNDRGRVQDRGPEVG